MSSNITSSFQSSKIFISPTNQVKQKEVTFRNMPIESVSLKYSKTKRTNQQNYLDSFQARSRSSSKNKIAEVIIVPARKKNYVPEIPQNISQKVKQLLDRNTLAKQQSSVDLPNVSSEMSSQLSYYTEDRSAKHGSPRSKIAAAELS